VPRNTERGVQHDTFTRAPRNPSASPTYTSIAMDFADHVRAIASNWWRILVISAVIGAGVFGWSRSRPDTYRANALATVSPQTLTAGTPPDPQLLAIRVTTYQQMLQSPTTAALAVKNGQLGRYGIDANTAARRLRVTANLAAGTIAIATTAETAQQALDLCNAFANALHDASLLPARTALNDQMNGIALKIEFLRVALAKEKNPYSPESIFLRAAIDGANNDLAALKLDTSQAVQILAVGTLANSGSPVAPRPQRDGLLAFLIALAVSSESFVLVQAFSDRVTGRSDVESITDLTGLPVLAKVPRGRGPEVVEAFRTLRTNLLFLEGSGRPRTIAIVSPNAGAGKSFCAILLAESAVAVDTRVTLVDADLRRPVLHQRLDVPREPGLSDALRGRAVVDVVHPVEGFTTMGLVPSGAPVTDTVGALGGDKLQKVLDAIEGPEMIIVDTPAGSVYADALAVAAQCDATLLVLDASNTRLRSTKQFIDALRRTPASLVGVVLNSAAVSRRDIYERA
jgi:Mrp family chromosome partitioning ATPase